MTTLEQKIKCSPQRKTKIPRKADRSDPSRHLDADSFMSDENWNNSIIYVDFSVDPIDY